MTTTPKNLKEARYDHYVIVSDRDNYIVKDLENNKFYKLSKDKYSFENLNFEEKTNQSSPIILVIYMIVFILLEMTNLVFLLYDFSLSSISFQKFLVWLICYFPIFIIAHELGHIAMLKKFGGHVNKIGFKLNYIFPSFFVRMNDLYLFNKTEKLFVHANGLFIILIMNTFVMLLGYLMHNLYLVAIAKYMCIDIFFNTLPFLNSDGYKILVTLSNSYELKSLKNNSLLVKMIKIVDVVFVVIYSILFINDMIND